MGGETSLPFGFEDPLPSGWAKHRTNHTLTPFIFFMKGFSTRTVFLVLSLGLVKEGLAFQQLLLEVNMRSLK